MGHIRLEGVSKFYGEVLGVNRISTVFEPGVTGLVGPNGAGKSTLLSLIAGLVRPSRGTISVLGESVDDPGRFYRAVGYCTQYDAFPAGMSGRDFMRASLRLYGHTAGESTRLAAAALDRVGLGADADRRIDAYSKGMRQALKLARAICHGPRVLLLDEPLNGLDPQARAEATELFREFAGQGACVLVSSHILHELEAVADRVVFMDGGYVVTAGAVGALREEVPAAAPSGPVSIRCDRPGHVAARLFALDAAREVRLHDDGEGLVASARDADALFAALGDLVCRDGVRIDGVKQTGESVADVYDDLIVGGDR